VIWNARTRGLTPAKHFLSEVEGTQLRKNPKSEARNSKQTEAKINPKPRKSKTSNPILAVWNIAFFGHLDLFRISNFVLRILGSWRLCGRYSEFRLRLCRAAQRAFARRRSVWMGEIDDHSNRSGSE
jgi:hypothetical protein